MAPDRIGTHVQHTIRLTGSAIVHIVFLLIAAYVIWIAYDLPGGGNMMPVFAATGVIVFSSFHVAREVIGRPGGDVVSILPIIDGNGWRIILMFAITVAYVITIFQLGYFVSTFLYLCLSPLALGVKSWRAIALTEVVMLPLMYGFFVLFLEVNLPKGLLF